LVLSTNREEIVTQYGVVKNKKETPGTCRRDKQETHALWKS